MGGLAVLCATVLTIRQHVQTTVWAMDSRAPRRSATSGVYGHNAAVHPPRALRSSCVLSGRRVSGRTCGHASVWTSVCLNVHLASGHDSVLIVPEGSSQTYFWTSWHKVNPRWCAPASAPPASQIDGVPGGPHPRRCCPRFYFYLFIYLLFIIFYSYFFNLQFINN